MTQIDFYTHVDDKLRTACRLVNKAYVQGLRVMVACPDQQTAQQLDRLLWTTPALGFVPHCMAQDPLAASTPVIIDAAGAEPLHDDLLVNLQGDRPAPFSRFRRLVEIVSTDDADRLAARERFKFYRDRGYEIRSHNLSGSTE
jgi:DNA polymerase III subunit chi